jgi:peptidoglycan hydrolase CwlO-like protein
MKRRNYQRQIVKCLRNLLRKTKVRNLLLEQLNAALERQNDALKELIATNDGMTIVLKKQVNMLQKIVADQESTTEEEAAASGDEDGAEEEPGVTEAFGDAVARDDDEACRSK